MTETLEWFDLGHEEQMAMARIGGPAEWSKLMNPEWAVPGFVRGISDIIKNEIERAIRDNDGGIVLISLPPGHNKSYMASINTPEWFLERWPDKRVAIVAYGHTRAQEWGEEIRNDIRDNPDKFTIRLRKDTTSKSRFHTDQGGGVLCTGIGGPLTGFRAHLVDIDDPVKDHEEANSEVMREKHWNWFRTVALTRRWAEATVLIVMTRWHEDDLVGRIEHLYADAREQGDEDDLPKLTHIRIPCEAEEGDPLSREPGELLWPEKYGPTWARRTKKIVGPHVWATMYQQRPSAEGGEMFRRRDFRYFREAEEHYELIARDEARPYRVLKSQCRVFVTVDTAMKEKRLSDYTVATTFALTPLNHLLVLDVSRDKIPIPDQWDFICDAIRRAKERPNYLWAAIEDKGSGTAMLQLARKLGQPFRALKADTDKVTRASEASVWYQNGMVYHRADARWTEDFERELLVFPNGAHDDQVDTVAYAVRESRARPSEPVLLATGADREPPAPDRGIFADFTSGRKSDRSMWRE